MIAAGIRVTLYGTEYRDDVATGTDGRYSLEVPLGSKLQLVTDDFDNATTDRWFPLINVDLPHIYANRDMLDWPIHCLPKTSCPEPSTVAVWDRFLADFDDLNGDRFVPTTAAESGGILAILFWDIAVTPDSTWFPSVEGYSVVSSTPAFPIGYIRGDGFYGPYGVDCGVGPDILYPTSRTVTDWSGSILSFGDPAYTGSSVRLTITDQNPSRNYAISSPWEVPVAPGMVTLGLPSILNGVPNRTFRDVACAGQLFACAP